MDLDDRIDFPDLGKSVGTTKADEDMCEDYHQSGIEEERGIAPMEPLNEACFQLGSGGAHAIPERKGLQGWAKVVAGSQEKELEDCLEVTVDSGWIIWRTFDYRHGLSVCLSNLT
ncbi:uncharacterized protein LOC126409827 [Nymphaea colorata]|uniref:uncharacterized protein LOC126409827 n=1 Tax=Nymphaea colorata TaxID=210225 RepID=UPI00214E7F59|nr:uncharacterized protein LOC126409827 [Nymphaea colorata]